MKTFILSAFACLVIISCTQQSNVNDIVNTQNVGTNDFTFQPASESVHFQSPIDDIDIETHHYAVNPSQSKTIITPSKTEIKLTGNCFVDKHNKLVVDEVTIAYKEVRSAADVILSGVPMQMDSGGVSYNFQTAGMYDIRGTVAGEPVFIKDGESITVTMESEDMGNYNFYKYNENGNKWENEGGTQLINNSSEAGTSKTPLFEPDMPLKPVEFDMKNDVVINVKADYKHISKLSAYKGIIWKYAGTESMEHIQEILSKRVRNARITGTDTSQQVFGLLLETKKDNEKHVIPVMPVLGGVSYKKAKAEYEKRMQEITALRMQLNQDATPKKTVKRVTTVRQFGLYNCDILARNENFAAIKMKYKIENNCLSLDKVKLFHISGDNNIVVLVNENMLEKFLFDKKGRNVLLAILPEKKVAAFSSQQFKDKFASIEFENNSEHTLVLKEVDEIIDSPQKLDNVISML